MATQALFNDVRPIVLFDPRASQRIDPRFKFVRDGNATYTDYEGTLRTAGAHEPRFDYDPVNKEFLGLLIERSSTNEISASIDFTTWSNPSPATVTITPNSAIAPDGTLTASRLQEKTVDGNFYIQSPFSSSTGTYTFSLYAKSDDSGRLLNVRLEASGVLRNFYVNLDTGAVTNVDPFLLSVGTKDVGNGWWRIWGSANSLTSNVRALISIVESDTENIFSDPRAGDGVSGFYVWGAQLEPSAYPTSYIPTYTGPVIRDPDLLSIERTLPATGSIYVDARTLLSESGDVLLTAANAVGEKLALAIRQPASLYNSKALVYEVGGQFRPTLPFPVPTNTRERNLITYGANNYHYRSDSARYTPSSSDDVPSALNRVGIGHDVVTGGGGIIGYINTVYLWDGEIAPAVAAALVRGEVDPKDADAGSFVPAAGSLAMVFNTQGVSTDGDTVVQLPLRGSANNVLVSWGDNTSSRLAGAVASVTVNHTYTSAGIYPVQIEAEDDGTNSGLSSLSFADNSPNDLVRILQWGGTTTFQPTTMYRIFKDCTQLDFEAAARTGLPDTSLVSDWGEAFYGCSALSGLFPSFDFSGATTLQRAWRDCSSLTQFPDLSDQTDKVTNFSFAWYRCRSLTQFPSINTSAGKSFSYAWGDCSGLTSFPSLVTSSGTNFNGAWSGCSELLAPFPTLDTSSATNLSAAWLNCSKLTAFPALVTSNCESFLGTWQGCSSLLAPFPTLDTSAGKYFSAAWYGCSALTQFPNLDTSAGVNFSYTWYNCSALTSFPALDLSSGKTFQGAWFSCSDLVSILLNASATSAGENFALAWAGCSSLVTFPTLNFDSAIGSTADTSYWTGFRSAWSGCTSLANFPPNLFNNTTCTQFTDAFRNCALTFQSIENILVSINTANTFNGTLNLDLGTNAAKSTWTAAANSAYNSLVARGWTVLYNS